MKHGSLFSGIGGFDLAAEWMGWENVFHCEWNDFGKRVLKHYWPKSISYDDITKTDFTIHRGNIDILTGGFPCQPYSQAGKRLGKEDDRHLWPEMLRAIREIQPTYVVGENVLGLVNWNGGLVFDEVQADLEAEGYEVQPFILPACAVNAPHRRDRVWFVAHRYDTRNPAPSSGTDGKQSEGRIEWQQSQLEDCRLSSKGNAANSNCNGQQRCNCKHEVNTSKGGKYAQRDISKVGEYASNPNGTRRQEQHFANKSSGENYDSRNVMHANSASITGQHIGQKGQGKFNGSNSRDGINAWAIFPTQSPICNGDDGLSSRLDGITFPKWRNESIKAGGNAIVPQVVYQIFKAIEAISLQ